MFRKTAIETNAILGTSTITLSELEEKIELSETEIPVEGAEEDNEGTKKCSSR